MIRMAQYGTSRPKRRLRYRALGVKNRSARSDVLMPLPVIFGKGISNSMTLVEIMKANDLLTGGAGWFTSRCKVRSRWLSGGDSFLAGLEGEELV